MLEMVPQGRGKCPITRIMGTQTRLESVRTPLCNELHIGHSSGIIHLKILCKNLSQGREERNIQWPVRHSEQSPYV